VATRRNASRTSRTHSFVSTFKGGLVDQRRFRSRDEAVLAVVEWTGWYNHRRLHSALADAPPSEYEGIYYRDNNREVTPSK
jgi:putative transposase